MCVFVIVIVIAGGLWIVCVISFQKIYGGPAMIYEAVEVICILHEWVDVIKKIWMVKILLDPPKNFTVMSYLLNGFTIM